MKSVTKLVNLTAYALYNTLILPRIYIWMRYDTTEILTHRDSHPHPHHNCWTASAAVLLRQCYWNYFQSYFRSLLISAIPVVHQDILPLFIRYHNVLWHAKVCEILVQKLHIVSTGNRYSMDSDNFRSRQVQKDCSAITSITLKVKTDFEVRQKKARNSKLKPFLILARICILILTIVSLILVNHGKIRKIFKWIFGLINTFSECYLGLLY